MLRRRRRARTVRLPSSSEPLPLLASRRCEPNRSAGSAPGSSSCLPALAEALASLPAPRSDDLSDIIHPAADPLAPGGNFAVLRGNLAPNTAVTKPAAIRADIEALESLSVKYQCPERWAV